MSAEAERGCGYRRPGGLYLLSGGPAISCDRLPVPICACDSCGFAPVQNRSYSWVSGRWLGDHRLPTWDGPLDFGRLREAAGVTASREIASALRSPRCPDTKRGARFVGTGHDPICVADGSPRLLMWVGAKFYSPASFTEETDRLGVSKRIAEIPSGLKLGETWVLLAHPEACQEPVSWAFRWLFGDGEVLPAPGVFSAFVPTRLEIVLHESEATPERLEKERLRGVDVVLIPDDAKDARVSWRPGEPRPPEAGPTQEERADAEFDRSFDRPDPVEGPERGGPPARPREAEGAPQ